MSGQAGLQGRGQTASSLILRELESKKAVVFFPRRPDIVRAVFAGRSQKLSKIFLKNQSVRGAEPVGRRSRNPASPAPGASWLWLREAVFGKC